MNQRSCGRGVVLRHSRGGGGRYKDNVSNVNRGASFAWAAAVEVAGSGGGAETGTAGPGGAGVGGTTMASRMAKLGLDVKSTSSAFPGRGYRH